MSSVRGGGLRGGRGRGSGARGAPTAPRGPSINTRGRAANTNAIRGGGSSLRGNAVTFGRGTGTARGRGGAAARGTATAQQQIFAPKAIGGIPAPSADWAARQKQLNIDREQEKKDAIAQGLMSDPDKAIALSEAITLVGTCQDMCPENERVTRAMRNELWDPEKDENGQADESRMVKRFKRSAAGDEVQLPSDLRPPQVLKRVCDYLFHELIEDDDSLAKNHHFVWDRTRGVRNDFSVQQISRLEDLRIAIDCFERIARFHIISLHLLAKSPKPYETYSEQQDREQLDRTLLSLLQYYDDVRGRLELPNEPEFRAYCIIFQLRDPTPDLEDRVQSWPRPVSSNKRVQVAVEIYAAACSTMYPEGPMDKANHVIARQNWERFWSLIISNKVSYLMGCVAEVYFNLLRHMMLNAIVRTARRARPPKDGEQLPPNADFKLNELWYQFNFDDEDQLREFVGRWGLKFETDQDGIEYLDIRNVAGRNLGEPRKEGPKQLKSEIVEVKRHYRTIPAVIDGLSVRQAREAGMIGLVEEGVEMMDSVEEEEQDNAESNANEDDEDSLFVSQDKTQSEQHGQEAAPVVTNPFATFGQPTTSAFGQPSGSQQATASGFSFGKPSAQTNPFAAPSTTTPTNPFQKPSGIPQDRESAAKSPFAFASASAQANHEPSKPAVTSPFAFPSSFPSSVATTATDLTEAKPTAFGQPAADSSGSLFAPKVEAAPKAEAVKIPPKKTNGPFVEEDSPTSPSPTKTEESASKFAGPPPTWNLPKTSDNDTATSGQPAAPSKQPPSQSHAPSTTNAAPPNNTTQNASITNGVGQSSTRRPSSSSANVDQHKPKKPSPLSNSFTAAQQETSPDKQVQVTQTASPQVKAPLAAPTPPAPTFETILERLANELTFAPSKGILKEFVEFTVKNIVDDVYETWREERLQILKTKFVARRYGPILESYMRERHRHRKLAKKGREARERRQRRHAQAQSTASTSTNGLDRSKKEMFNSIFHSSRRVRNDDDGQARAGSKRPAASDVSRDSSSSVGTQTKRSRKSEHEPPADSNAEILKKSSFLGFSLPSTAPNNGTTTKSTYFRMKAMGIPTAISATRGIKRPRAESDAASAVPATRLRSSSSASLADQSRDRESMPPPTTRSVRSRTSDDDDALFARLRAAREALKEGEDFMKEAVEKEEVFRKSLDASHSSNESPSMARARAEARLRASKGASDLGASFGARDVPAYRLRQSRFLSAEEQARAVERAREIRASRAPSRETSRPASRTEEIPPPPASPPPPPPPENATTDDFAILRTNVGAAPTTNGIKQSPKSSQQRTSLPAATFGFPSSASTTERNPFSQSSTFAPPPRSGNPFLQTTSSGPAPSFHTQAQRPSSNGTMSQQNTQRTFGAPSTQAIVEEPSDHTVRPSQIPNALSHTFGQSHPTTQNSFTTARSHESPKGHANSFTPSQAASAAISLLSDDEEEAEDNASGDMAYGQQQYFGNGMGINGAATASFEESVDDELPDNGAYINPFAVLADGADQDEDEGAEEDEDEDQDEQQWDDSAEDHQRRPMPNSYQYSEEEEESYDEDDYEDDIPNGAAAADDDGFVGDEEDEGDYHHGDQDYDTEEEYDEDDDAAANLFAGRPLNHAYSQHVHQQAPEKDPALQEVGNSVEEAIELSD